jgi:hypothetical protein
MSYNGWRVSEVRAKRGFGRSAEGTKSDTRLLYAPDGDEGAIATEESGTSLQSIFLLDFIRGTHNFHCIALNTN